MKLSSFHVSKFRNVVDSGPIKVDELVTCLVGKNEAGKSGLLEALYLFNPAYADKFDVEDQYPRCTSRNGVSSYRNNEGKRFSNLSNGTHPLRSP